MSARSDDLEIFVFPAANPTAQENLLISIENSIRPESVVFDGFEKMSEDLHNELNRIKILLVDSTRGERSHEVIQTPPGERWLAGTTF
jgi:hypothetical protein